MNKTYFNSNILDHFREIIRINADIATIQHIYDDMNRMKIPDTHDHKLFKDLIPEISNWFEYRTNSANLRSFDYIGEMVYVIEEENLPEFKQILAEILNKNKRNVLKQLIVYSQHGMKRTMLDLIEDIRSFGVDWPQLDVIEKYNLSKAS